MAIQLILLVAGLALIVYGANWLVDGASAVARKAGVSEFVIGLTIVGFGTSCPELVVSLTGALQGNADVSIGNVLGSNIFNILLILGITALFSPIKVSRVNTRRDIPITIAVTLLFCVFALTGRTITRVEGVVFLLLFAAYIYSCFKFDSAPAEDDAPKKIKTPLAILLILAGLAALIGGGRLFVDNAVGFAKAIGVSDKFIAITLLAGGTSLPELATCVVAAAKKRDQLALGNVLGSNVFNILLILGCSASITPLSSVSMSLADLGALVVSTLLILLWSFTGKKLVMDRWEGVLMVLCFASYMVLLTLGI